jgi:nitric oxide dioxygenase
VYAYAANIDNIAPLVPVVDRINQKHASLGITPDQYAVVGEYLLKAITDVLGVDVFKVGIPCTCCRETGQSDG